MTTPTVSLHDLLEELRARDEAIDSLVVAYFKLEAENKKLKAENESLKITQLLDKIYKQVEVT